MSSTWAAAAVPGPVYVGGQKLLPLSYGHAVLLERVSIVEILTPIEFWGFVGICKRNFSQGCKWLNWFLSPVGQWYYSKKPMPKDCDATMAEAYAYLANNMKVPEIMEAEGGTGGAKHGAHFLQGLRSAALSRLNYSPNDIMDAGFLQLVWDVLALNEQQGGGKIIDGRLAEGLAELERLEAERRAEL